MIENLTTSRAKEIAEDIEEWASSKQGKKSIKSSLKYLKKSNKKFKESLSVSRELKNRPVTI